MCFPGLIDEAPPSSEQHPLPASLDFSGRLGEVAARSDRPGGSGGQAFRRRRCASGS